MKKFTMNPIVLWKRHMSKNPWFVFNTNGLPDRDGRVKVEMDWNRPFIDNLLDMGVGGHNEEEIVEAYLMMLTNAQAAKDPYLPEGAQAPVSANHPQLSSDSSIFRQ